MTDRNQAEKRIRFLALSDPLTGLPNRRLITTRLQEAIATADEGGSRLGIVLLDLDRFTEDLGLKLENIRVEDLGKAKKVTIDKDTTTTIDSHRGRC